MLFRSVLSELKDLPEYLSASRPAKRIPWGILVPNEDQTIYVWIDALINYYTALGYPENIVNENDRFGNIIHIIGKDILRFHALIWPALLLVNQYPLPKQLIVHSFWLLKNVYYH